MMDMTGRVEGFDFSGGDVVTINEKQYIVTGWQENKEGPGVTYHIVPVRDEPKRLVRVLVYEGSAKWVDGTLDKRAVKGELEVPNGKITESFLDSEQEDADELLASVLSWLDYNMRYQAPEVIEQERQRHVDMIDTYFDKRRRIAADAVQHGTAIELLHDLRAFLRNRGFITENEREHYLGRIEELLRDTH